MGAAAHDKPETARPCHGSRHTEQFSSPENSQQTPRSLPFAHLDGRLMMPPVEYAIAEGSRSTADVKRER